MKEIIEPSKNRKYIQIDPWREIINKMTTMIEVKESIKYLENIMSEPDYPSVVKSAALQRYEMLTSDAGTGILLREQELGLPLQQL